VTWQEQQQQVEEAGVRRQHGQRAASWLPSNSCRQLMAVLWVAKHLQQPQQQAGKQQQGHQTECPPSSSSSSSSSSNHPGSLRLHALSPPQGRSAHPQEHLANLWQSGHWGLLYVYLSSQRLPASYMQRR
jgi:hypothetical protein